MACETSLFHIPPPNTSPQIQQSGNNAGQFSPQMLQRLSCLPYITLPESAITDLLDDDGAPVHNKALLSSSMNQSSIHFPTPEIYHYDSSSSNSSASSVPSDESHIIIPRSRRVRGLNSPTASISHSLTPSSIKSRNNLRVRGQADAIKGGHHTPELSDTSDVDIVRPLQGLKQASNNIEDVRLGSLGAHPRHFSSEMRASSLPHLDSHIRTQFDSPNVLPQTRSIRKKSGEPIKPSLKRPKLPSLSVPTGSGVVKSEPTTPTLSKAVHFDAKLEHVKLFLAKQKPLAVSRDHDATTDTSGTESDFPSVVSVSPDDYLEREIELQIRNMPLIPPEGADVALQKLTLSQSDKTIVGMVRVRNIAYEKWVAARFTLDFWQTTSEVTARYTESVDGSPFDIFTFSIRLHDMWARIDEKTMFIALRYTVAGRQFWDNNSGANYMIKFVRKHSTQKASASAATIRITEDSSAKVELERVDTSPLQVSPLPPSALPGIPVSVTYYLDSALKISGGDTPSVPLPGTRTPAYRTGFPSIWSEHTPYRIGRIPPRHSRAVTIGSPKELVKKEQAHIMRSDFVEFESPFLMPHSRAGRERDHRQGHVNLPMDSMPRKSPPSPVLLGLPGQSPIRGDYPVKGMPSLFERFTAQTITRDSSERSAASTMSNLSTPLTSLGPGTPSFDSKLSPSESYSQFLNQFCFFTGSNSSMDHLSGPITRSRSASDVEAFLRPHSPSRHFPPPLRDHTFNGLHSSSLTSISAS